MIQAEIDGAALRGREALHGALAEQLRLPPWYGKNLDALYDCLTEPGEALFLRVRNAAALGNYAKPFLRVLEAAQREGKRFRFELAEALEDPTPLCYDKSARTIDHEEDTT